MQENDKRYRYAKKDLELKLAHEDRLAQSITEPLTALYKCICANRLYSMDNLRKCEAYPGLRKTIVERLYKHYIETYKTFKKFTIKGFVPKLESKGIEIGDAIDPEIMRLLQARAERQADIIMESSVSQAKNKRDEIIVALLQEYVNEYREDMQEYAEEEGDNGALVALLAALATRTALISQVETGNAGEVAKLITTLEVRDSLRRAVAGDVTEGQLDNDLRTIAHNAETLDEFLAESTAPGSEFDTDPKKEWNAILDSRTRETHAQADGQVVGLMEYFQVGDSLLMFPGDTSANPDMSEIYNCYSKDTEVLTKDGFKFIKDVKVGEVVASVNPKTKQFQWTTCTNRVKKKVESICNIKTNLLDLSVSPDHTFFYYKKKLVNGQYITAEKYPVFTKGVESLTYKNTSFLATTENWQGEPKDTICGIPVDIFCKFMGYYLSDGNVDKRKDNAIHIAQRNNDAMYNELKPYLHICQGKEKLFIYNKELYALVAPLGYAHDKRIPEEIKSLPADKIRIFLDAFASCDGTPAGMRNGKFNGNPCLSYNAYYTTSPKMMADLVECVYKTNMSCSVYVQKNKGKQVEFKNGTYTLNYDLFIVQELKTKVRNMEKAKITTEQYNDYVYDIEVADNHTILVKRGKDIHWNSNCRCIAMYF